MALSKKRTAASEVAPLKWRSMAQESERAAQSSSSEPDDFIHPDEVEGEVLAAANAIIRENPLLWTPSVEAEGACYELKRKWEDVAQELQKRLAPRTITASSLFLGWYCFLEQFIAARSRQFLDRSPIGKPKFDDIEFLDAAVDDHDIAKLVLSELRNEEGGSENPHSSAADPSSFDTEESLALVAAVKEHPCIWDLGMRVSRQKRLDDRAYAWVSVWRHLYSIDSQAFSCVNVCRRAWSAIRADFDSGKPQSDDEIVAALKFLVGSGGSHVKQPSPDDDTSSDGVIAREGVRTSQRSTRHVKPSRRFSPTPGGSAALDDGETRRRRPRDESSFPTHNKKRTKTAVAANRKQTGAAAAAAADSTIYDNLLMAISGSPPKNPSGLPRSCMDDDEEADIKPLIWN